MSDFRWEYQAEVTDLSAEDDSYDRARLSIWWNGEDDDPRLADVFVEAGTLRLRQRLTVVLISEQD
jgi:hypothetical protein